MKRSTRYSWAIAGMGALCALPVCADSLSDAISAGKTHFDLRYRYELVDQDGFADNANASTLRARFNFQSGGWNDLSGYVELAAMQPLFVDDYNSGAGTSPPRRDRYPVVADQDYAEVNQVYLQYSGWNHTQVRVGRQMIYFDNKRFIGDVGWRQNDQTYDAVSISHAPVEHAQVYYAYIDQINRIFGHEVPAGEHDTSTHLLHASYGFAGTGTLAGYYYSIDNDDAPAFSTNTIGARFAGNTQLADKPVRYLVEYARQSDAANNPVNYDADYVRLDAAIELGAITPSAGYELQSGDRTVGGAAFRTPLATLHAFNGWADLFLSTPDRGLVDTWLGLSGKIDVWSWSALYHQFASDAGSVDYGNELDLVASRKFGEDYSVLLKAALFDGDPPGYVDVTKLWFMFTANF